MFKSGLKVFFFLISFDAEQLVNHHAPGAEELVCSSLRRLEDTHSLTCKVVHVTRTIAPVNSFSFLMFYTDDPFIYKQIGFINFQSHPHSESLIQKFWIDVVEEIQC